MSLPVPSLSVPPSKGGLSLPGEMTGLFNAHLSVSFKIGSRTPNGWTLWYPWLIQSEDRDRAADRSSERLQDRTLTTQAASEETSSTRNLPPPPASR